jgi:hypothetical protein
VLAAEELMEFVRKGRIRRRHLTGSRVLCQPGPGTCERESKIESSKKKKKPQAGKKIKLF